MQTFTGYEPKGVPITMGPSGTTQTPGSASSSGVPGQIVPADTLADDLGNLVDASMISSLEDFLDEPIVPISVSRSGPKGLATQDVGLTSGAIVSGTKVLAPKGTTSSNDAIVAANQQTDLELENANLRKALEAINLELHETKIHAESYAHKALQDSRSKAEQALAFQKGTFEKAHEEYSITVRDICESEVAQSTANLEAIANSVIGGQQQELQTASIIVANLQQHLSHAQQMAAQESQDKLLIEAKAKAAVDAQKVSSSQQLSALRVSLEQDAQASHSKILKGREDEIKSEAEARHTAGMQQQQEIVNNLQSQLQQAALKHQELEVELVSSNQNCIDSEGNLVRLTAELRKTQDH